MKYEAILYRQEHYFLPFPLTLVKSIIIQVFLVISNTLINQLKYHRILTSRTH